MEKIALDDVESAGGDWIKVQKVKMEIKPKTQFDVIPGIKSFT